MAASSVEGTGQGSSIPFYLDEGDLRRLQALFKLRLVKLDPENNILPNVVDNLVTDDHILPLSAAQGKILAEAIAGGGGDITALAARVDALDIDVATLYALIAALQVEIDAVEVELANRIRYYPVLAIVNDTAPWPASTFSVDTRSGAGFLAVDGQTIPVGSYVADVNIGTTNGVFECIQNGGGSWAVRRLRGLRSGDPLPRQLTVTALSGNTNIRKRYYAFPPAVIGVNPIQWVSLPESGATAIKFGVADYVYEGGMSGILDFGGDTVLIVGFGTSTPSYPLTIDGNLVPNNANVLFLPTSGQTEFAGIYNIIDNTSDPWFAIRTENFIQATDYVIGTRFVDPIGRWFYVKNQTDNFISTPVQISREPSTQTNPNDMLALVQQGTISNPGEFQVGLERYAKVFQASGQAITNGNTTIAAGSITADMIIAICGTVVENVTGTTFSLGNPQPTSTVSAHVTSGGDLVLYASGFINTIGSYNISVEYTK